MSADPSPTIIDLAREPPFQLGAAQVRPATREMVQGERREVLEPRVMQVLVALARSGGEVVSRGDLIQDCWAGRVVGEDAINRCIAAVRRLAQAFGGFDVETIPRVGYRLTTQAPAAGAAEPPARRRWVLAGGAALVAVAAAALLWTLGPWRAAPAEPKVALRPFLLLGGSPQLKVVADGLSDDVAGALNQTHLGTTTPDHTRGSDILVGATLAQDGADLRARAYLLDASGANTLWTASFVGPAADLPALRDQVSGGVTEAAQIAVEPFRQKGLHIDAETLALYIKGGWAMAQPNALKGGEAATAFAAAVARAPNFVAARGMLAFEDMAAASQETDSAVRAAKLERARGEALAAIRDDARVADGAYYALYRYARARGPTDLAPQEDALRDGVAKAPQSALLRSKLCEVLTEVGRARQAVEDCKAALALRPMGTSLGSPLGHAAYIAGGVDLARKELDQALRYHPDSLNLRTRRMEIALFSDTTDAARARLHDDRLRPQDWQSGHVEVAELFLKARDTHASADIQRFVQTMQQLTAAGLAPPRYFVLCAAALDQTDVAFKVLTSEPVTEFDRDGFLFEPATDSLRHDPRFWLVARKFGLTDYWRKRNIWPDFCGDTSLGYDCRTAAASAASASISSNVNPRVSLANSTPAKLTAQAKAR